MKRIIGAALVLVLILSLAATVFATGNTVMAFRVSGAVSPVAGQIATLQGLNLAVYVQDVTYHRLADNLFTWDSQWQIWEGLPEEPTTPPATEPATQEPTTQEPTTEPTTTEPTTQEPTTEPTTTEPTTQEPTTEPVTSDSAVPQEPTTQEPTTQEQTPPVDIHSGWKDIHVQETFLEGKTYRLKVTVKWKNGAAYDHTDSTRCTVNGFDMTLVREGEEFLILAEYKALPADLSPILSPLEEPMETAKDYDGKPLELKVSVTNPMEGVGYAYQWYQGALLVESNHTGVFQVKDVTKTGTYHCKVVPYALTAPDHLYEQFSAKTQTCSLQIRPIDVTLTFDALEKNLFDTDPVFTYQLSTEIFDELEGEAEREEGEDIGTYVIRAGTLAFPEAVKSNYNLTIVEGSLTVVSIGELPFVTVGGVADLSYIVGAKGSTVQVITTTGALPENSVLSLTVPPSAIRSQLEAASDRKLMKCFYAGVTDEEGWPVVLPSHAILRFRIPLTEQEATQKTETILAKVHNGDEIVPVAVTLIKSAGVSYMQVETTFLGAFALYEGDPGAQSGPVVPPVTEENPPPTEEDPPLPPVNTDPPVNGTPGGSETNLNPQPKDSSFLWVLILLILLAALGIVIYTEFYARKNKRRKPAAAGARAAAARKAPTAKPAAKSNRPAPTLRDELDVVFLTDEKEKEKNRKLAGEMNRLSPIPNGKPAGERKQTSAPKPASPTTKRPAPSSATRVVPKGAGKTPPSNGGQGAKKPPRKPGGGKVISFEDLED